MSAGRGRAAKTVEMMMTADSLRLTACGQDEDEMLIAEDLPEAEPLNVRADNVRLTGTGGCRC
jgi:hypothetical protein